MPYNQRYPHTEQKKQYSFDMREISGQNKEEPYDRPYTHGFAAASYNPTDLFGFSVRPASEPAVTQQSNPPPLLSDNPAVTNIVLFKQLTAYPNYGNPSRNADILYTGNTGTWTFDFPAFLFVPGRQRIQLTIRAVLDDHYNVPASLYTARITINGEVVHIGRVPLEHGSPAGGMFTNWRDLNFNVNIPRRINRITIVNTSRTGPNDWIGLDWMEMRLSIR